MEELIRDMKNNIKCYNKFIPDTVLDEKSILDLMCWTHPMDREDFKERLNKIIEDNTNEEDKKNT